MSNRSGKEHLAHYDLELDGNEAPKSPRIKPSPVEIKDVIRNQSCGVTTKDPIRKGL